jgi:hypothetical protein
MTDTISNTGTEDLRFYIRDAKDIGVIVYTEVAGEKESTKAELIDISVNGARLKTREPLSAREIVGLEFRVKQPNRLISVSGEVCWMVPTAGDYWGLGCSFSPKIPLETLRQFAEDGILERRQHRREDLGFVSTAKWELDQDPNTVRIINYSEGGFCLMAHQRGKPGERVMLQFELDDGREILVRAKAQWQVESEEGFVLGCEFLHPRDFTIFSDLKQAEQVPTRSIAVWRWFGKG